MSTLKEKDEEMAFAIKILGLSPEGKDRDALTADLRRVAGTASPAYRAGRSRFTRAWNWALDTEYVVIGPPPIAWIGLGLAAAGWCVAVVLAFA